VDLIEDHPLQPLSKYQIRVQKKNFEHLRNTNQDLRSVYVLTKVRSELAHEMVAQCGTRADFLKSAAMYWG
jgi:hypothetical protein